MWAVPHRRMAAILASGRPGDEGTSLLPDQAAYHSQRIGSALDRGGDPLEERQAETVPGGELEARGPRTTVAVAEPFPG
jgi:hypothetical protein